MMIMVKRGYNIFLVSILILCLSIGFAVEAQEQDRFGGTLKVAVAAAPTTLDWQTSTSGSVREVSKYIWEGLIVFDASDKLQPMLAKDWEISEDGLTWTFHLLEGVLFHNGKEMTSEDVVASFKRWVEVSPFAAVLTDISSINAVDKYTVEVKSNERLGALPSLMAQRSGELVIMPKEVCEGVPAGKITEYIGTGPYKFEEWRLDQYIKLVRFDDYHHAYAGVEPSGYAGQKNAYLDEIIVNFIPETSTLLAGLETGEFDVVKPILPMEVPRLKESKDIKLQSYVANALDTFFNTKHGPFQDVKLRRAAVIALDMEEIMLLAGKSSENIELVASNFGKNSIWYTGEGEKCYNQKDTEGAKKLMQEAGYNGEELVMLTTKHYPWMFDMAISIIDQLSQIGFNFKIDVVDWPTLVERRAKPEEWDLFTTGGSPSPDPIKGAQNYMGTYPGWWTCPEIQEYMKIMLREDQHEKRYDAWKKAEALFCENPQFIGPGRIYEFRGYRNNIKGLPDFYEGIYWNVYKE